MSDEDKQALIIVAICIVVVIALIIVFNIIKFFVEHAFLSGLLIGIGVGVGGTYAFIYTRNWIRTHRIIEIDQDKK